MHTQLEEDENDPEVYSSEDNDFLWYCASCTDKFEEQAAVKVGRL